MHSPRRVIVVDDDQGFLDLAVTWLRDEGYDVAGASRFADAKRMIAEATPDVLISDLRLGAFNGLQLVVLTRQQHPEMAAIVLTGHDDAVLRSEAARAGAQYVVKPVAREELLGVIAAELKAVRNGPVTTEERRS